MLILLQVQNAEESEKESRADSLLGKDGTGFGQKRRRERCFRQRKAEEEDQT